MRQILFEVPGLGLKVYGFGLMLTLALLASMNLAAWRARRERLDPNLVFDLAVWILVGGLVGARAFFVVEYWSNFKSVWELFQIWNGGIVFYGSVLGGAAAFLIYAKLRPFPIRPMMDVVAPSLAVGIAVGRVGCYLNGCCFGDTCDLPWAVTFPAKSSPWVDQVQHHLITADWARSLPVHPTQLYSALDGLVLFLLLSAFYPLRRRDGQVFALLMIAYPVTRFLIERLRNDEAGFLGGMTVSQAISVSVLAGGVALWVTLARKPAKLYREAVPPSIEVVPARPGRALA